MFASSICFRSCPDVGGTDGRSGDGGVSAIRVDETFLLAAGSRASFGGHGNFSDSLDVGEAITVKICGGRGSPALKLTAASLRRHSAGNLCNQGEDARITLEWSVQVSSSPVGFSRARVYVPSAALAEPMELSGLQAASQSRSLLRLRPRLDSLKLHVAEQAYDTLTSRRRLPRWQELPLCAATAHIGRGLAAAASVATSGMPEGLHRLLLGGTAALCEIEVVLKHSSDKVSRELRRALADEGCGLLVPHKPVSVATVGHDMQKSRKRGAARDEVGVTMQGLMLAEGQRPRKRPSLAPWTGGVVQRSSRFVAQRGTP